MKLKKILLSTVSVILIANMVMAASARHPRPRTQSEADMQLAIALSLSQQDSGAGGAASSSGAPRGRSPSPRRGASAAGAVAIAGAKRGRSPSPSRIGGAASTASDAPRHSTFTLHGGSAAVGRRDLSTPPKRGHIDFEHLTVGDVWDMMERPKKVDSDRDYKSLAIRRPLSEYEDLYLTKKLVLAAGHTKRDRPDKSRRFPDYYAVDALHDDDREPDAVLDITNESMMAYFPDNWADEVHVDDSRILVSEATLVSITKMEWRPGKIRPGPIRIIMRILKPGKTLVFPTQRNTMDAEAELKRCGAYTVTIEERHVEGRGRTTVFVLTK